MKKKLFTFLASISMLCLASCNSIAASSASVEIISSRKGKTYSPNEIEIAETFHSIEDKRYYNTQVMPSIGNVNLLVVPVLLPDYEGIDIDQDGIDDNDKVKEDLNKAFFGKAEDTGFESVSSFYKKSSNGKLNIKGTVTDFFYINDTNLGYSAASQIDIAQTYEVAREAVNYCKTVLNIDMSQYDNDKDGYIDGLWLIYSAPNYQNGGPRTDGQNYWAYTTWGNQRATDGNEAPDVNSPVYNLFGWASYDFMYETYGLDRVDAHTYIHETGHFLGLNDYYSDNYSYSPIGRCDMMDANIIDHNSYSKMLLGWTKPYVVTGSANISLSSFTKENNCLVILDDETEIVNNKFDPFSEYILVEYYENDGLNYQDSQISLTDRVLAPTSKGFRVYHVDNRKFLCDVSDVYNVSIKEYEGEALDEEHKLLLPLSNARGYNTYNHVFNLDPVYNLYDEIRMIEANNVDTFSNGGYQKEANFFKDGDSFTIEKYGKTFFYNGDRFNNGHAFTSEIKFSFQGGK